MAKKDLKGLLVHLAEQLKVNLGATNNAIATGETGGSVSMHDGSLKAIIPLNNLESVRVQSPRAPGISVELINHNKDYAPAGAIYKITAYRQGEVPGQDTLLNEQLPAIYVGREGLLLDSTTIDIIKRQHIKS